MLHKTPSAFGLTAFLLHEGCSTRTIRSHSLLFSMSAPLSSILTYLVLAANPSDDPVTVLRWTGILLLFSAGTFLYVSTVHILPEIYSNVKSNNNHHHHRLGDQYQLQMRNPGHSTLSSPSSPSTAAGHSHDKHLSIYQFSALIFGMLVPFFISQGVSWEI